MVNPSCVHAYNSAEHVRETECICSGEEFQLKESLNLTPQMDSGKRNGWSPGAEFFESYILTHELQKWLDSNTRYVLGQYSEYTGTTEAPRLTLPGAGITKHLSWWVKQSPHPHLPVLGLSSWSRAQTFKLGNQPSQPQLSTFSSTARLTEASWLRKFFW